MSYTSSVYIFFVLAGLLVSAFLPARFGRLWLIGLGLAWLVSWNVLVPFVVGALIVTSYFCAKKGLLWPVALLSLAVLISFRLSESPFSVGSSFYVLILLAFVTDVVTRKEELLSFEETFLLGSFFPLMMAGPVERGSHFRASLRNGKVSWDSVCDGLLIFSLGFLKFKLLHSPLTIFAEDLLDLGRWYTVVYGALLSVLNLYISLSSFADMGRGVARMFGIEVVPSFLPVFFARDPSDFWERWNRTVASWFRDYLVFPSLLRWGRKVPSNLIVFFAFVLLGLWHGFDLEWLCFGIFNGIMVILGSEIKKKTDSAIAGRVLVFFLFLGNGLIYVGERIFEGRETELMDLIAHASRRVDSTLVFGLSIAAFLLVEWLQEKKKENDFFLRWPTLLKRGLAIVLLLLWVLLVDHRGPTASDTLPLYFEL